MVVGIGIVRRERENAIAHRERLLGAAEREQHARQRRQRGKRLRVCLDRPRQQPMRLGKVALLQPDAREQIERGKMARRAVQDRMAGALGAGKIPPLVELKRALE